MTKRNQRQKVQPSLEVTAIRKAVRVQAFRIAGVMAMLIALIAWQKHFVVSGIESNIYLNGIIIGVFLFGSWLAIWSMVGLRNDIVAFQALKEVYDDALAMPDETPDQVAARFARCLEPGIVYSSPNMLGHVFDLTIEELLRSRHMRISIATMQNLMATIDLRMAHQRSLIGYLTGLSVFLGLIGTFIGLMEMVSSVGGIIGGLASGDSGSPDSIKRLIRDLEAPLVGMATGFSSSLFGLFGSLMLGLIGRMSNAAAYAIKEQYEAWLAGISEIETGPQAYDDGPPDLKRALRAQGRQYLRAQLAIARSLATTQKSLDSVVEQLARMSQRQDAQSDLLARTSDLLAEAADRESLTLASLRKVEDLRAALEQMRAEAMKRDENVSLCMMSGFERLAKLARDHDGAMVQSLAMLGHGQMQTDQILRNLQSDWRVADLAREANLRHGASMDALASLDTRHQALTQRVEQLADSVQTRPDDGLVANAIVYAVNSGVGNLAGAMQETMDRLAGELGRLAEAQRQTQAALARQAPPDISADMRAMGAALEEGLGSRLQEIAQSVDTAFQAYARLLQAPTPGRTDGSTNQAPAAGFAK